MEKKFKIITKEDENRRYDRFKRQARDAGFTDDQINFLWDWIMENQDY
jgi:hypothetical protein